ncbi:MBL fold metallo-hydrolase [Sphingomonas sp. LB3N6]|uniref:MBL fold metallo-hydrolase n=1 Tax=Sphingomonas fucosidasi TaxID=3096164 RepID=UPI002FCC927B
MTRTFSRLLTATAVLLALTPGITAAQSAPPVARAGVDRPQGDKRYAWVTLGTQGGPMPSLTRSEPANLLVRGGAAHLIDAGDNAMTRAIGAGATFQTLQTIWLSHLHFDHIGGMFGVLGLRNQTRTVRPLTIYGPPGTRQLVEGLFAAMTPSAEAGFGIPGESEVLPSTGITIIELNGGENIKVGDMTVRAVRNSHYSFPAGSDMDRRFASLSYRFDLPDRSIVYTGDTGPSAAVERLANGADLLVSEMIDLKTTRDRISGRAGITDPRTLQQMVEHLTTHHLTTQQVGELAAKAGVKRVVLTHFAGGTSADPNGPGGYAEQVKQTFKGPVVVAADMDRF